MIKILDIQTEILKFWQWAEMSPEDYSKNRGYGEWEGLYPGWKELEKAIDEAIFKLNEHFDYKTAEILIQALAIDNEAEGVLEKIEGRLKNYKDFIELVIKSNQPEARWQIAELLGRINLKNRDEILSNLIIEDEDNYVKRRALLSLNLINPLRAIQLAVKFVDNEDDYLKMVATKIISGETNY
ncbi:HEAT repeat domain-containing protein [Adhaeribacter swui]|uniref:HEAT repeat domain-containing protein n=1 Tax=Adhaeribacter swui TaxID=2086471 RepID=UPI003744930C